MRLDVGSAFATSSSFSSTISDAMQCRGEHCHIKIANSIIMIIIIIIILIRVV